MACASCVSGNRLLYSVRWRTTNWLCSFYLAVKQLSCVNWSQFCCFHLCRGWLFPLLQHAPREPHVGLETSIRVFYSLCRGGWADSTASTEQIHDVSASLWPYTWRCLFYVWRSVLLPNFRTYPDCFHRQRSCTVLQVVVLCPYQPNKSCLNLYISAYIHLRFMKDHSTGPCIQLMYDLNTV